MTAENVSWGFTAVGAGVSGGGELDGWVMRLVVGVHYCRGVTTTDER